MKNAANLSTIQMLEKTPTGIEGLDELTNGGLPKNRTTLVTGGPGCGKTVMAMEFLMKGIEERGETGVFFSFEEDLDSLIINFAALGYDLQKYVNDQLLIIEYVHLLESDIVEAGEFTLEPIFLRLEYAIEQVGAKRVAIDTVETLFSALSDTRRLRSEIKRLFVWLQDKNVTAIVTGEKGQNALTRHGLEEYVSDCVIVLDHRIMEQVSKRRLRIVKYRGSRHISDETPFLISKNGIVVIPVTSLKLDHRALKDHISTGIPDLDQMMDYKGYYKGTSILVSGTSGTGKSSIAAKLADATCSRGEKCLYFSFEESVNQICRNMSSIGLNLDSYIDKKLLSIKSERTSTLGLEEHLLKIMQTVKEINPLVLIMDPITNFFSVGNMLEIKTMLTRLLDFLKAKEITGFFTSLTGSDGSTEQTNTGISSIMDTWLIVRDYHHKNEKKRLFYLLKSRGMKHSQKIKEMFISDEGIKLMDLDINVAHTRKEFY
jgi:circadian clock protein KaiC